MAESIDELKIEVEAQANDASTTIKGLSDELKSLKSSLEGVDVSKLRSLGTTFDKIGNINLSNSSKELRDLDKQIDSVTKDVSKNLSDNLIDKFNITNQRVQKSVESMSKKFMELNRKDVFEGTEESADRLEASFAKLENTVASNAHGDVLNDSLSRFYDEWSSRKPIYVSDKIIQDINPDNWKNLLKEDGFIGSFTTNLQKMQNSIDSAYEELAGEFPDLFPDNIVEESEQFEKIIDVVREYKDELADTTSVAQGFEDVTQAIDNTMMESIAKAAQGYGNALGTGLDKTEQRNAYNQVASQPGSGFSQSTELISELASALKKLPDNSSLDSIADQLTKLNNVGDASDAIESVSKLVDLLGELSPESVSTISEISDALGKLYGADFEKFVGTSVAENMQDLADGLLKLTEVDAEKLNDIAFAYEKISSAASTITGNEDSKIPNVTGGMTSEDVSNLKDAASAENELKQSAQEVSEAQREVGTQAREAGNEMADSARKVAEAQKEASVESENTGNNIAKSGSKSTSVFSILQSAINKVSSASKGMGQVSSALLKVGTSAAKIETKALAAGKSLAEISLQHTPLGKLPAVFDKISSACSGLNGKLTKSVHLFTMMAMRSAFRSVMDELGESFEHLAQKSEEVNQRYSSLISSMNQLAHSIAALAQPLLNIFGPALEYIINLLNDAINYVNQFLSALTGKSSYTTGKRLATDYAASLQDEADSAEDAADAAQDAADAQEELNKQLQGFNELNNMTTNLSNGSNGNNGTGLNGVGSNAPETLEDCYEELAINQKILDLVQKLKDLLSTLFEPMKAAWDKYGQGVVDALKYALSSVWQLIKDIGQTWLDVWTNGSGEELCSNILKLLTSILNWIGDIATAWDKAWKTKGEAYVQSIFDLLNAALETIIDISETFREAFNNGAGVEMLEHILQILTNSNNIIKDMILSFKAAWDAEGRGQAIAETLFAAINSILTAIEKIQEAWSKVWNNGTGTKLCGQILDLVLLVEKAVQSVADAFTNAWTKGERGEKLIQSILNIFSSIIQTITDIGNSLLTVWNNGSGEEIIGHILQIFTDINGIISGLVDAFDRAWKKADTGTSIIQGICDIANTLLEHAEGIYASFKDWVEKLDFSPLLTAFDKLVKAVEPLADNVGSGLEWFYEHVLQPVAKWAIETAFPVVLENVTAIINVLNSVIGAAKANLGWFWTDFLKPIGEWTGNLLVDAFSWLADCLEGLVDVFNGNKSVWDWIQECFWSASQHTTKFKADIEKDEASDKTAVEAVDAAAHGHTIRSEVSAKISKDSSSDSSAVKAIDSDGKTLSSEEAIGLKLNSGSSDTAIKAIESDNKTLSTEESVKLGIRPGSTETATKAIDSADGTLNTEVSTKISQSSSSDEDAVKAVNSDKKSLGTTIITTVTKAANGISEAWNAIKLASQEGNAKAEANIEANLTEGGSNDAWEVIEDGVYKNKDMNFQTSVKLVKSGWETITGWFKDKFGGLFSGSSDDESITVKIKLDKKNSEKVEDVLSDTQTVKIVLSDKSEKLSKVLDSEFTTKVKLSKDSQKLSSILDDTFTTKVKLSDKSEKLSSILDSEFTTKIKLKKSGWESFTDWIGATEISAKVSLKPSASSLWKTLKDDWSEASGTVEFSADVKDESSSWWKKTQNYWKDKVGTVDKFSTEVKDDSVTWWKNTQSYWSKKVGTVDKFKTDVKDEGSSWWKNAQSYWKKVVGTAEKFKTDVKDEGSTWWKNAQNYWKKVVGKAELFKTDVKDESSTWWKNVQTYWKKVVGYVDDFRVKVKDDSKTWWSDVKTYWDNTSSSKYLTVLVQGKVDTATDWWTAAAEKLKKYIGTIYAAVRGTRDTSSDWWNNLNDVLKSWIGTVYVGVRARVDYSYNWWQSCYDSIKNSIGTVQVGVTAVYRAKGGVYQNGTWSDIPQYAGGTVNAGSLFVAGEAGAELVGHIGNRTEVLNESQLAAVMKDSVIAGISSLAEYLNGIYKHMTVCTNAVIGAIAVNYDTPQVAPDTSGYCRSNDLLAKEDQYGRDMSEILDLLGQIADNTEGQDQVRTDTNRLFTIIRQKNQEYRNATGNSAFA